MKGRSMSEGGLPGWLMSHSALSYVLDGNGWVTWRVGEGGGRVGRVARGHRWPWEAGSETNMPAELIRALHFHLSGCSESCGTEDLLAH